ncbi:hypothetical protein [Actinocorallia aurantiaca]|jgi:hypothetical protein|uniref:Uncharacterized protein n=1 Tax=Actinocorallia aurantiaca TaxID=46204 RepID=A0ABP6H8V1_9ACTN
MASLIARIKRFLASPQGQQARTRAEQLARDPRNKARIQGVLQRFGGRRRH